MSFKDHLDEITKRFESPEKNKNEPSTTNKNDFHELRITPNVPGRRTDFTFNPTPAPIPGRIVTEHGHSPLESGVSITITSETKDSDDAN